MVSRVTTLGAERTLSCPSVSERAICVFRKVAVRPLPERVVRTRPRFPGVTGWFVAKLGL